MNHYFGTDGFRGEVGVTLTAGQAFAVGQFLGHAFRKNGNERGRVVIGKDTRRSSYMLEYAVASGIASAGSDAFMLHVTTTPCVSFVTRTEGFDAGIMISASHNPFSDNGIKIVNAKGEKADDAFLKEIEDHLDGLTPPIPPASGDGIGQITDYALGRNRYVAYLISLASQSFRKLRVGLDCANGSAWSIGKNLFEILGATVFTVGTQPDGKNINRGVGSTHPETLARLVVEKNLDVGFAFDGDADRCIAADEKGNIVNGDQLLYLLAARMKKEGTLLNNTVVATVMSNLALPLALEKIGIRTIRTRVGDRYVYENLIRSGNSLGGEQSGHIIMTKYATTGDGLLTAIRVCETILAEKTTLSALVAPIPMLPQTTVNVRVNDKTAIANDPSVNAEVEAVRRELGDSGRILLRESGTEPVLRVMVEAPTDGVSRRLAERVAGAIRRAERKEEEA